ncbi:MAG: hypothetical protein KDK91_17175 [Gammaproteobacteria bacterium]|nr:hypothetical protein [Gammaproteobacteria bacterium]
MTISKAPGETVVDVLTEQVHLTRGNTGGLFNARLESGFDHLGRTSPLDTEWAHGSTADDLASLDFTTWDVAFGGQFSNPGALIGVPMVVHLLSDDIYLDFTLTDWGGVATQGRFSYERSSPVPVPAALLLLAGALPLLVRGTRRRC